MQQNGFLKLLIAMTFPALIIGNEILTLLVMVGWGIKGVMWLFAKMIEGGILK